MSDKLYSPTIYGNCIEWQGAISSTGYGLEGKKYAHRLAMERLVGAIPKHLVIDHICRNRRCVNIGHLRVVTRRENALENNDSPHAINAARTHCKNGHEFDAQNTYFAPQGDYLRRYCRKCKNRRANAAHAKRRAEK